MSFNNQYRERTVEEIDDEIRDLAEKTETRPMFPFQPGQAYTVRLLEDDIRRQDEWCVRYPLLRAERERAAVKEWIARNR